jgi:peptidoglycan/xylan/chitin deacetylase (PgdA/CDA1 family)|tara:strand:- start:244 stop:1158 length:915 start_codon:yes stop_codon:yes gene_type:complete
MNNITIVTYHYVREISGSNYPNIKGLEFSGFKRQLDYLEKNFNIIKPLDLINNSFSLPENSCLLTFDDGLKNHIEYVLPELNKRKIKGCFFPPGAPVEENRVLDVHLIHFILEKTKNKKNLVSSLNSLLLKNGYLKKDLKVYWDKYAHANRFDPAEIIYFKRMLQKVLPFKLRNSLTEKIFLNVCDSSVKDFAKELYMNKNDIKDLLADGMYVGSHTYNHYWLNTLTLEEQRKELDISLEFLKNIGVETDKWIMCYPYGAYNSDTISLLKEKNCSFALTIKPGIANLKGDHFELPRKDTNDFPQ